MKASNSHVIMQGMGAKCLHCSTTVTFHVPVRTDIFAETLEAFSRIHSKCEKPISTPPPPRPMPPTPVLD